MTPKVKSLLRARNAAYRTGDTNAYFTARSDLKKGISSAKQTFMTRIEAQFNSASCPRQVWEGVRAITDYKGRTSPPVNSSAPLAEELNIFYARFDRNNKDPVSPPLPSDGSTLVLSTHEVRLILRNINIRKAAGPDGVQGRVLKDCAAELAPVLTTIFNLSLASSWVPGCLKAARIVPVPKKPNVAGLNNYRPVALTPIVAKCFEKLVMKHIKASIPPSLDQNQFAYRRTGQQRMPLPLCYTLYWNILSTVTHMGDSFLLTLVQLSTLSCLTSYTANYTNLA
ncbi:uncharacterized protein LOC130376804 [Gadus chalcogrammus]|uniref:uncharacterized protein LOC130376804 n=1 Tax=Gadus chalcogrammus TaxID=1042646 RepID=UPI0024C47EE5|nr:uncharacterized protein LOC130376804 [Gadus chalcogrammus]